MAAIRLRGSKWQVQIRRTGCRGVSKSFLLRKDAVAWARQIEAQADRAGLPADPRKLKSIKLSDLIKRYQSEITVRKRGAPRHAAVQKPAAPCEAAPRPGLDRGCRLPHATAARQGSVPAAGRWDAIALLNRVIAVKIDYARKLARASNVTEATALQFSYCRSQVEITTDLIHIIADSNFETGIPPNESAAAR